MLLGRGVSARIQCHGRIVAISPCQVSLVWYSWGISPLFYDKDQPGQYGCQNTPAVLGTQWAQTARIVSKQDSVDNLKACN